MAIGTYAELRTAAASWLHRSDLSADIPNFIGLGEWRMARDLRISPLMATATVAVSAGASTGTLPTGYLETINIRIASGAELVYVPPDTIDRVPSGSVPWCYTLLGTTITVAPTWTAGGNLSVTYFKKETELSDSATTNWYILNAPDTLLYATLMEAAPFLNNDSRVGLWKDYYKEGIGNINRQYGNVDPHKRMQQYMDPAFNGNSGPAGA